MRKPLFRICFENPIGTYVEYDEVEQEVNGLEGE